MDELKNERKEQEIVFSKAIKAGKRIYYLDVKRSRNSDLFLAITESKKRFNEDENAPVTFEKHKIFLYKEDFEKFSEAFLETIEFINKTNEANGISNNREYRASNVVNKPEAKEELSESPIVNTDFATSKYDVDVDFEI